MYYLNIELGGLYPVAIRLVDDKIDEICAMITYVYGRCIVSVDYYEALAGKQETLSKGYCPYDSTHKLATFTEGDDEQ